MISHLQPAVESLNEFGNLHLQFAVSMWWQLALVVGVIALLDLIVLHRVRTSLRYSFWCLIPIKLLLPVTLANPVVLPPFPLGPLVQTVNPLQPSNLRQPEIVEPRVPSTEIVRRNDFTGPGSSAGRHLSDVNSQNALRIPGVLFAIWGIVAVVLSTLLVRQNRQVAQLVAHSRRPSPELEKLLADLLESLRLPASRVAIRLTSELSSPAICGFWKATILIPDQLTKRLGPDQMRLIVAHELIHWKRWDLQMNCLQALLQIVYFYNPVVWYANAMLRRLREYAVDEATVVMSNTPVQVYSQTLIDVADFSRAPQVYAGTLLGALKSRSSLYIRIQRLVTRPVAHLVGLSWTGIASLVLLGVFLLPQGARQPLRADDRAAKPIVVPVSPKPEMDLESNHSSNQTEPNAMIPATQGSETQPNQMDVDSFPMKDGFQEDTAGISLPPSQIAEALTAAGLTQQQQTKLKEVASDEIVGVVLDESTGKPLSGVTVDAWHWHPGNETKTDDFGQFRLKGLDSRSKTEILVSKDGYGTQVFTQSRAGAKDWIILLGNRTYIEGTITDATGSPVANATIRAKFGPVHNEDGDYGLILTETRSQVDGKYRVYAIANEYELEVMAPGRGVARQKGIKLGHRTALLLNIRLQPGVRFEALVVDSVTGLPQEGFCLYRWQPPYLTGRSNREGRIIFTDLPPGKMTMECGGGEKVMFGTVETYHHGPFGRWWSEQALNPWQRREINQGFQRNLDDLEFDLQTGMAPVKIFVEQGVTVSGRVTDPLGLPVEGATVAPAKTGSGNSLTGDTRYSVSTDKEGRYTTIMPAGNQFQYNLIVHDGKYSEWRKWANGISAPLQSKPGQKIDNFDLQLTEPAVVRGRILEHGKPVTDREVRTHDFYRQENRYYDPTTRTLPDGTFELKFVRPGKHYLQVAPFYLNANDASQGSMIIDVKAKEILTGIQMELSMGR